MNLSLSTKIRLMDARKFYTWDRQPCWYVEFEKNEKRKQSKWKIGVYYNGEREEYTLGVGCLEVEDDKVWNELQSIEFAEKLMQTYKVDGKKAAGDLLKGKND